MRSLTILSLMLSLSACTDLSVKRERGETKNGYTTFTTTVHAVLVDEPACVGSCQP